jgi:hypothetical protein
MKKLRFAVMITIILVFLLVVLSVPPQARDLPSTQGALAVALVSEIFTEIQPSPQDSIRLLTSMGISPKEGWDLDAPVTPELLIEIYQDMAHVFPDGISPVTKTMLIAALHAGISFPEITTVIITSGLRWTPEDIKRMKEAAQTDTNHYSALESELNRARKAIEKTGISAQQSNFPFTMADFRAAIKEAIGEDIPPEITDEFIAQILADVIGEEVKQIHPPLDQRPPLPPPTKVASPSQP